MTIKEIDNAIDNLRIERRKLEKQEREEFIKNAQKHVGRCFKINDKIYAKVLSVPVAKQHMTYEEFNQYQYPAIFLKQCDDGSPFELDTLFSGAWGVGNPMVGYKYEEITQEEFNREFDIRMNEFMREIKCIGSN